MKFELFQQVRIISDISKENVKKGEVGTVVEILQTDGVETAYMVELSHDHPHLLGVITVTADQIERIETEVAATV